MLSAPRTVNRQLGTVASSTASGANTSAAGMVALSMAAVNRAIGSDMLVTSSD
jgi:hypothetical protein